MTDKTIFSAATILTMDANRPRATHVAVREGRVLGVGTLESLKGWGAYRLDDRFAARVLMPGFVEGHAHAMSGNLWRHSYLGHMDRFDPAGRRWRGVDTTEAVVVRLGEAAAALDATTPLLSWGFDPLFVAGERLARRHLDTVSSERPIVVLHSNGHLMTGNSAALALAGYSRDTMVEGVRKDEAGELNGELQELAAMGPVFHRLGLMGNPSGEQTYRDYAELARRTGVTTAADLGATVSAADVTRLRGFIDRDDFPIRLAILLMAHHRASADIVREAVAMRDLGSDKLRLGAVKIILDGSIQGFTAQLRWPGYYAGEGHGMWNVAPEQLFEMVGLLNEASVQTHIHTNGDEATELALEAFARALAQTPRFDHRHTLQHCQMADEAQFRRMKALSIGCNLFSNHLYYFGDKHYELTIGPDRAERMNACATALRLGVPFAIHSDEPVTPIAPLFTAWCAVNRVTEKGRVLGEAQRIPVAAALSAITLGAAYSLKMDGEVGSIEIGKWADFAVLDADPTAIDPMALKDVGVVGTVLAGMPTGELAR